MGIPQWVLCMRKSIFWFPMNCEFPKEEKRMLRVGKRGLGVVCGEEGVTVEKGWLCSCAGTP